MTGRTGTTPPSEPATTSDPILVVDDDDAIRDLFGLILRRAGFPTIEAASGEACLELMRSRSVALLLLDINMPGMSGLEVLAALRRRPGTSTIPVIVVTGSGDEGTGVEALDAGADDFLPKPPRPEELLARVRAHLRKENAWTRTVQDELRGRSAVVSALGRLGLSSEPEGAAAAIVAEVGAQTGIEMVRMLEVTEGGRLRPAATYTQASGLVLGGQILPASRSHQLISLTRGGPWVETVGRRRASERMNAFWSKRPSVAAGAPIYSGTRLVGVLILGLGVGVEASPIDKSRLLAAAIDYATVLTAFASSRAADDWEFAAERARLRAILTAKEFHTVFQPIVALEGRGLVGHEALTRFTDGVAPEVRFAEAAAHDLGAEFEIQAIAEALLASGRLPARRMLTLNVSGATVVKHRRRLQRLLAGAEREYVLELTEHASVDDYPALIRALRSLKGVQVAVDDTGAGFASLRHLLELHPDYVKLDISLVRGIDADDVRQSLVAGLDHFAALTGYQLIAEGVETEEEAEVLGRLGVQLAQGHLVGRPSRPPG